ncbi:hypothetical protein [Pseudomonas sp. 3A(2025)]
MARINVLSGDFLQGDAEYRSGTLTLVTALFPSPGISFNHDEIQSMEIASQASSKNIDDAIGLGLAGALMLGPLGAAAGMMLAGEEKEITFLATLKDGRTLLAATDDKTFRRMARHIGLNL